MKIDILSAPAMVSWQMTKDCDLACLHCCTGSAPGRALPGELSREQALELSAEIISSAVPYVMLCGGEPTIVPHFLETAEFLGNGGVFLKIETNGQGFSEALARRLSRLPIRSVQISLDGATQGTYSKMRPGASLEKVKSACALVRRFGMPLELTFAPTRLNLHEAQKVIDLALEWGAFRFNTGKLMRLGTAAKLWDRLCPTSQDYDKYLMLLESKVSDLSGRLEMCYKPFSMEAVAAEPSEPPGTLLVLPDGKVKVSAALPFYCADLKKMNLPQAWEAYRQAWRSTQVAAALGELALDPERLSRADLPGLWVVPA